MKKILMIAFHYPPYPGGSGTHRTLKFSKYLTDYDWQPIILTAAPKAYPQVRKDQLHDNHQSVKVRRAFALDTARHLSLGGSYLKWMALPDRWVSWWLGAVVNGLQLVRQFRPQVIWSTYPIASAHLIGLTLHRLSGIPWIADFRDSMTEDEYPRDPTTRAVYRWIERLTVKLCAKAVFTAPGSVRMYAERYPEISQARWELIPNGYDEEDFAAVEKEVANKTSPTNPITLVHSGLLYPSERDPRAFFEALGELRLDGKIAPSDLRIILRASGNEESYRGLLRKKCIDDIVFLEALIPHRDAVKEMLIADGLLIFQASNCNHQIPAKIYEYLRARRPIFAMTDPEGDTAALLKSIESATIVPLDSKNQIARGLHQFLAQIRESSAPPATNAEITDHSRRSRTRELAKLIDKISNRTHI